ncbi:MAG: DUF1592 domain-containing protein [Planctomycetota bacterium]
MNTSSSSALVSMRPCWNSARTLIPLALSILMGTRVIAEDRLLEAQFQDSFANLISGHCLECHSTQVAEADVDLEKLLDWKNLSSNALVLQRALEQIKNQQMPPVESKQLASEEKQKLLAWSNAWLRTEAQRRAGDPGPVILRRLNNAEYTYTLRDLTGITTLDPAKEFPADGAAGEGFSNAGAALAMSPALVQKYLDAGKAVAKYAVLLPDGIRFETNPSSSDMTNQLLDSIRDFYARYTDQQGGDKVNLQGIVFETNQGGRLPVERYIAATIAVREQLANAGTSPTDESQVLKTIAEDRKLNLKYLTALWQLFSKPSSPTTADSGLLESLRRRWLTTSGENADALSADVLSWQKALWRFSSIGHIGKVNGPKAWQEPVDPIQTQQEIRFPLPDASGKELVSFFIQVGDAGDGNDGDAVLLKQPRLVAPGRPEILLRDLESIGLLRERRTEARKSQIDETLAALGSILDGDTPLNTDNGVDWNRMANERGLDRRHLQAWGQFLGITGSGNSTRTLLSQKQENHSGYDFIDGWVGADALSIFANASSDHVRVPGNMPGKTVGVHPAPTRSIGIAWKSPVNESFKVQGRLRHAHAECGNGVAWRLELHRGGLKQILASGFSNGANDVAIGPIDKLLVRAGNEITMVVEPRDGNHSCDLTNIDLTIATASETWDLAKDITSNILDGNPHADSRGRPGVWSFFSEQVDAPKLATAGLIDGSLLARWFNASDAAERATTAASIEQLILKPDPGLASDHPDRVLMRQLDSAIGPFWGSVFLEHAELMASGAGQGVSGEELLRAPITQEYRVPASLASGTEFMATALLHPELGKAGSIQLSVSATKPEGVAPKAPETSVAINDPSWAVRNRKLIFNAPILVAPESDAIERTQRSFHGFRQWFPIALCYPKIVPVDEVVTLTLFHREDEPLQRLMLSETERDELDRLWSELHYVSRDALKLVDAYEQLWQYATQDSDPKAFEPLEGPIRLAAERFRNHLAASEPAHVASVLDFARKAFRGSHRPEHDAKLRKLYSDLRLQELPHAEAIEFLIARILVSPEFLYRTEIAGPGTQPSELAPIELANRLSYFLWASAPDEPLLEAARDGSLVEDAVLEQHVRRMIQDPRIQRMAVEWGCMWLHIRDLDTLDEKSESHFPEFKEIRSDLYREAILWITHLLQNEGRVSDFLTADHTFVNDKLAAFYGIPDVAGTEWRKIEGIQQFGRGGILGLGATLAKQSGASRTSPILRGTWISEIILGEKLPKPPKNVPVLSETPPEGMTERQLIERHSSDPACAKCHVRIDPFGYAMEGFDAIGRARTQDASGKIVDTSTRLPDGTPVNGMSELRSYLLKTRSEEFTRQFNRKLMGYALGRSIQLSDEPVLDAIREQQINSGDRIADTIVQIVLRSPFRQIRGRDTVSQ